MGLIVAFELIVRAFLAVIIALVLNVIQKKNAPIIALYANIQSSIIGQSISS
jgi:hypothetical protein